MPEAKQVSCGPQAGDSHREGARSPPLPASQPSSVSREHKRRAPQLNGRRLHLLQDTKDAKKVLQPELVFSKAPSLPTDNSLSLSPVSHPSLAVPAHEAEAAVHSERLQPTPRGPAHLPQEQPREPGSP